MMGKLTINVAVILAAAFMRMCLGKIEKNNFLIWKHATERRTWDAPSVWFKKSTTREERRIVAEFHDTDVTSCLRKCKARRRSLNTSCKFIYHSSTNNTCKLGNDNYNSSTGNVHIGWDFWVAVKADGEWSSWGIWTSCDLSSGTKSRSRTCDNLTPLNVGADCVGSYSQTIKCQLVFGNDCAQLYNLGQTISGTYLLTLTSGTELKVYCDMTTDGGGWTVFQRRQNGSISFERGWADYLNGFGTQTGEFWLGNEKLHLLTLQKSYELRIDLEDFDGVTKYALYKKFSVGSESTFYKLDVGNYSGTAGDSLTSIHGGQKFSTKDRDKDASWLVHCAAFYRGGWWFGECHQSNLNGFYYTSDRLFEINGIVWFTFRGFNYSLKKSEMKIRPVS